MIDRIFFKCIFASEKQTEMKTTFATIIIAVIITVMNSIQGFSQTVVIAHASAEVIESVSASSNAVTGFSISQAAQNSDAVTVNLGSIKVNLSKNLACNVVVTPATISNASGNSLSMDLSLNGKSTESSQLDKGNQTIQLSGKTQLDKTQTSGNYGGSYSMVFAYN